MHHTKPRYQINEVTGLLGISRAHLYVRIREGKLTLTKDGVRAYIDAAEIDRYVAACRTSTVEAG